MAFHLRFFHGTISPYGRIQSFGWQIKEGTFPIPYPPFFRNQSDAKHKKRERKAANRC